MRQHLVNRIRQSSCSRRCQLASGVDSRLIDGDVEEAAIKEEVARNEGRSACHEPEGRSVRVDDSCSVSTKSSTRCRMPTLVNAASPTCRRKRSRGRKGRLVGRTRHIIPNLATGGATETC